MNARISGLDFQADLKMTVSTHRTLQPAFALRLRLFASHGIGYTGSDIGTSVGDS